jgi:hypothetical protein
MKRKLLAHGMAKIRWLHRNAELPENLLLHISDDARDAIFEAGGTRDSGQQRINMLFRLVQQRLVNRASVETVARQKDPMKRARDARLERHLGREGILVLGHQEHDDDVAAALGLPIPRKGAFVSARVVPSAFPADVAVAEIEGSHWRLARDDDAVVPAPQMPRSGRSN